MAGRIRVEVGLLAAALVAASLLCLFAAPPDSSGSVRFETSWSLEKKGVPGSNPSTPGGVAVGPDGTVFVGMDAGGIVRRFTPDGRPDGRFRVGDYWLFDLATAPDGDVLVETSAGIARFTAHGEVVEDWDATGLASGTSSGFDVAPDGTVYVAEDEGAVGVVMLDDRGRFIKRFGRRPGSKHF